MSGRAAPGIIFLIVFLDLLGVGLIAPLTPYIVERFSSSGTAVALLTLSYSAAQFLATPCMGAISDRVGRRPVLLVSVLGSAVGYVIFATAWSLPVLLFSRVLDGATGGNISTAQACIADFTPPKDRSKAYGLFGAAFGLGFVLGPAFAAALVGIHPMAPIWGAAALSLVTGTLVWARLPETLPPERRRREALRALDFNPVASLARALAGRVVALLLGAMLALSLAHAELRTAFGLLLRDRHGLDERGAAGMFAYVGVLAVIVQGFLVRKVAPALGDRRATLVALPLAAAGYFSLPLWSSWPWLLVGLAMMGLGGGIAGPSLTGLLSRSAPERGEGLVMGASQAASSLGLVIGPIIAGPLYDHAGAGWPFWTAACLVLAGLGLVGLVGREPARAPDVATSV